MTNSVPKLTRWTISASVLSISLAICSYVGAVDKLTYHNDYQRSGWNAKETLLTPKAVASPQFAQLWQTPKFDSVNGTDPRLFATPLFVEKVTMSKGDYKGKTFSVIYAATDLGYVYAVNAANAGDVPAGTILWSKRVAEAKPAIGNLSTPVIDTARKRLYIASGNGGKPYSVHALDLRTGDNQEGWPVAIDAAAVNAPGINRNGAMQFPAKAIIQRGALNLSPSGSRVYVSFAEGQGSSGWIVAVDTNEAKVATAFSATATPGEIQGGMWASGGPSVDSEGYVHIATGSSVQVHIKKIGLPGIFLDSEHNWGQSVIRLRDDPKTGFELVGTYSPFNYAQAQVKDIDLGSSGNIVIDLDPATTSTPHLLVQGGKQGNVYLLDRKNMPGSLVKRPPMSEDSSTDGSLLSPEPQPQFGKRGPLNVFGPYADENAMNDQARIRSTASYFKSANGKNYVFVTGSAKTGQRLEESTPPNLARLEIVTAKGKPAYLKIDQLEATQTMQNPSSPMVTSDGGKNAIVWVLDTNTRRTAPMQGPSAGRSVLYAFDALTLELIWKSAPDELGTTGKYNEVTVANGQVIVGTDRIQVFGLLAPKAERPKFAPIFDNLAPSTSSADPKIVAAGKAIFEQRCAACHQSGAAGIPTVDKLSKLDIPRIVDTLQNGLMRPQATGLQESELKSIATYLTSLAATDKAPAKPLSSNPNVNVKGRAIYIQQCISCHMPDGSGMAGLQPALTKNPVVMGEPSALISAVLNGKGSHNYKPLSDADLAELISYVRQAFGKDASAVEAKDIAAQRKR
jgi:mono/diheme cytochrome c family protein